jgi:hypothetical protein
MQIMMAMQKVLSTWIQEVLSAVSPGGITVSPELFAPFCGYIKYTPL